MEAPDGLIAECLSWDLCVGVTVDDSIIFFQRPFDEKRYNIKYDRYGRRFKEWLPVHSVVCMGSVPAEHLTTSSCPMPEHILVGRSLSMDRFLDMCEGVATFVIPYVRVYSPSTDEDVRRMVEDTLPKIVRDGRSRHVKPKRVVDDDGFVVV